MSELVKREIERLTPQLTDRLYLLRINIYVSLLAAWREERGEVYAHLSEL
jgi:hypothetical protein